MVSNILKSNQPTALILTTLIGLGLWIGSFLTPIGMNIPSDCMNMPFYEILTNGINKNPLFAVILTFVLIFVQALLLIQFNKKFIVINFRTYLPAFFYLIIASSFTPLQRLNPVVFGTLFIYLAIYFILSVYRTDSAIDKIYIAGFFISIASMFWAPFAVFFSIVILSLIILRPFIGREWIVSLLGFLTPYFFVFVYYFSFKSSDELDRLSSNFFNSFNLIKQFNQIHYAYYIFYGLLFLLIAAASISMVKNFQKKKIRIRKFYAINWYVFIISILIFVFFENVGYEIVFIIGMPISFLLTDYFYAIKRNRYFNIVLLILFSSLVYIQIIAHNI
ncbi:MAG: hypothetical protein JEY96_15970 [Bacteroidales bacterium]|nr:hypothetical protein [Bacteroidales bacterium]